MDGPRPSLMLTKPFIFELYFHTPSDGGGEGGVIEPLLPHYFLPLYSFHLLTFEFHNSQGHSVFIVLEWFSKVTDDYLIAKFNRYQDF